MLDIFFLWSTLRNLGGHIKISFLYTPNYVFTFFNPLLYQKINCMAIIVSICYANYNYKNNGDYGYHAYNRCNHQYSKIHPNPVVITTKPSLLEILKNIFSKMHKFFSNSVSYLSTSLSRVSRQVSVLFIWYLIFSWLISI